MKIRVGFGYDVHELKENTLFYLGGVKIEHTQGAVGHSDADVLVHAICDALLGAANLRDIGYHFPDTDQAFKGISSTLLLERVIKLLSEKNYKVVNIDTTILLQIPKISTYIPEMQSVLAKIMHVNIDAVSVKATTTEKLGFIGRQEGVAAQAVVLIQQD